MNSNIRRTALLGLFTAVALALYLAESLLPPPLPVAGVRLGLANVVTLILLIYNRPKDALAVLLARILLGSIFAGQMLSFLYSLCGGLVCFFTMAGLFRLLKGHYIPLISIFGALTHNLTQLLVAVCLTAIPGLVAYLPILILSGCITGLFTGLCAMAAVRFLGRRVFSDNK